MRRFLPLLLWMMLVMMGPEGIIALSQITGLEIASGIYDFQADHTMVYAQGKKDSLLWSITVKWRDGKPEWIMFSEQGAEL